MLPPPPPPRPPLASSAAVGQADDAIRGTDDDAAASRYSAVSLGYLADPFASVLYKPHRLAGHSGTRKAPLINVGTHHRTIALDAVVNSFLATAGDGAQVVSLGAGSDTRFWRLHAQQCNIGRYVEVDFPQLTAIKAQRIARSQPLTAALVTTDADAPSGRPYTVSQGGTALTAANYALVPLDLRGGAAALDAHILPLLDVSKPTILIAECVFCYMAQEESAGVIQWLGRTFSRTAAVIYEMHGLDDAFGRVMRRNLSQRNLSLPGAGFASPQAQAARFLDSATLADGVFDQAGAKSLWDIRNDRAVVPKSELERISKLEILDEIEELQLVLSHYCVAWASKGLDDVGLE